MLSFDEKKNIFADPKNMPKGVEPRLILAEVPPTWIR
jgi:hypothetical protein